LHFATFVKSFRAVPHYHRELFIHNVIQFSKNKAITELLKTLGFRVN
jgi:hypothetical protein